VLRVEHEKEHKCDPTANANNKAQESGRLNDPHPQIPPSQSVSTPSSTISTTTASLSPTYHFHNALECIQEVYKAEGIKGFYRGLNTALFGVAVSSAVYFYWYQRCKTVVLHRANISGLPLSSTHGLAELKSTIMSILSAITFHPSSVTNSPVSVFSTSKPRSTLHPIENILIATIAGVINIFFTLPIWVVNARLAVSEKDKHESMLSVMRSILSKEGLGGFYKGLFASLLLVSNPAIQFVAYEQIIRALKHFRMQSRGVSSAVLTANYSLTSLEYFIIGAVAKAIATIATYPIQVIKSRAQVNTKAHPSFVSLCLEMWKEEGISAFYRGMEAKMSQTVLNSAFMFVVYERLVLLMRNVAKSGTL
jgi:adenine nucleotide transporter 17